MDDKFGYDREIDHVCASEPWRVVDKPNVSAERLADATTVGYNAAETVKADPRLYCIDGSKWADRAREIEAEKEAERERERQEFMEAYQAMLAEEEAEKAAQADAAGEE